MDPLQVLSYEAPPQESNPRPAEPDSAGRAVIARWPGRTARRPGRAFVRASDRERARAAGPAPASCASDSHGQPVGVPTLTADFSNAEAGQVSSPVSKPRQRNCPFSGRLSVLRVPQRITDKPRSVFAPGLSLASRPPIKVDSCALRVRQTEAVFGA
jgi:hypothetical protein